MYKLNANFLTHFLNFGRYSFWLCTQYQVRFDCIWAAARLCHHFWSTIRPMLKNLAKPSTMASETHPSSFKQLRYTQTYCPTIQHGNAIFHWSRHCLRICRRHVIAQETFVARYIPWTGLPFSSNSDRRDILPGHPRRQSHLLPDTSWPENLL